MSTDEQPAPFNVGDVVYCEGSSAILGDVTGVDEDGVHVAWRATGTLEQPEDLVRENTWSNDPPAAAPVRREYLDVRYDVTDLTDDEKGTLALEAQAMAEARDYDHDGTGGHPDVKVEIEWNTVEAE